jgi:hypothetical protein
MVGGFVGVALDGLGSDGWGEVGIRFVAFGGCKTVVVVAGEGSVGLRCRGMMMCVMGWGNRLAG